MRVSATMGVFAHVQPTFGWNMGTKSMGTNSEIDAGGHGLSVPNILQTGALGLRQPGA